MKPFEAAYICLQPFWLPLHRRVRRQLLEIARRYSQRPHILDVGGRKSHYTIGVPADVTVTDLPRETDLQKQLNLGVSPEIIEQTYGRRSNIRQILLDNMTNSSLPDASVDCIVAVEVLEHVAEDERFIHEVQRVLRPGGIFLMTTPNGDSVQNSNPDHKRHYTREQLRSLLASCFDFVEVEYAIRGGVFRRLGLRSWSIRRPWRTVLSMAGNFVNAIQSTSSAVREQAKGTHHLVAVARRQD